MSKEQFDVSDWIEQIASIQGAYLSKGSELGSEIRRLKQDILNENMSVRGICKSLTALEGKAERLERDVHRSLIAEARSFVADAGHRREIAYLRSRLAELSGSKEDVDVYGGVHLPYYDRLCAEVVLADAKYPTLGLLNSAR